MRVNTGCCSLCGAVYALSDVRGYEMLCPQHAREQQNREQGITDCMLVEIAGMPEGNPPAAHTKIKHIGIE